MKVSIHYCSPCGYRERAESLASELRERFAADVAIEEGKLGQFDVLIDGDVVASKGLTFWARLTRHGAPPQQEMVQAVERHIASVESDRCDLPECAHPSTAASTSSPA